MEKLLTALRIYGLKGIHIYFRLLLGNLKRAYVKPNPFPIYLRRKTSDIDAFHQMFEKLEYDIEFYFSPKTIIDAGANIGLAAVYFANRFPNVKIISIEPEKNNFSLLKLNTKCFSNVVVLRKAISNLQDKQIDIIDNNLGNWGFTTMSKGESNKGKVKGSVKTVSVNNLMRNYNFTHIDILKIDIEGGEEALFESNYDEWLPKTRCIIIELHERFINGSSDNFLKAVDKYNFSFFESGENLVYINEDLKF